jgi:hypothetical protein
MMSATASAASAHVPAVTRRGVVSSPDGASVRSATTLPARLEMIVTLAATVASSVS